MKIKARLFICFALLIMAIIPAINYKVHDAPKKKWHQWFEKTAIYNLDFILPSVSQLLYPVGISITPSYVVVGKNDWLFLGDTHEQSVTRQRSGFASENLEIARLIGVLAKSRNDWLKTEGVSQFILILDPDKSSIYSDQLPNWAKPATNSFTDDVVAQSKDYYLDRRVAFKAAKLRYKEPLYFKTDTHWNNLGGWVAYRALAERLSQTQPELVWFSENNIKKTTTPRKSGDLANFLRMTEILDDKQINIDIDNVSSQSGETYSIEYAQDIKNQNPAEPVSSKVEPLITIKSKDALNKKRVLWLHDSFGFAMEPFLYGTFSEVLQGPYKDMDQARFEKIVNIYKPDYVFMTVVERKIAAEFFLR